MIKYNSFAKLHKNPELQACRDKKKDFFNEEITGYFAAGVGHGYSDIVIEAVKDKKIHRLRWTTAE